MSQNTNSFAINNAKEPKTINVTMSHILVITILMFIFCWASLLLLIYKEPYADLKTHETYADFLKNISENNDLTNFKKFVYFYRGTLLYMFTDKSGIKQFFKTISDFYQEYDDISLYVAFSFSLLVFLFFAILSIVFILFTFIYYGLIAMFKSKKLLATSVLSLLTSSLYIGIALLMAFGLKSNIIQFSNRLAPFLLLLIVVFQLIVTIVAKIIVASTNKKNKNTYSNTNVYDINKDGSYKNYFAQ